ncbi:MAG: hypothetical protein M1814_005644 [Vezdaea aestivalis]|nr:MAG: hypothetical protein M1814_005644 [Vezdaea aestivalis]
MDIHKPLRDKELRLLSADPQWYNRSGSIDQAKLETQCPLDNGRWDPLAFNRYSLRCGRSIQRHTKVTRTLTTAPLLNLPFEITQQIFQSIDLETLTHCRAVSWGTRALIDSLPEYNIIISHAPNTVRALLTTELAHLVSPLELLGVLCTERCSDCGHFGILLDLFTCRRLCYLCLRSQKYLTMEVGNAMKTLRLKENDIQNLNICVGIPGEYNCGKRKDRFRPRLIRAQNLMKEKPGMSERFQRLWRDDPYEWSAFEKKGYGREAYWYMPVLEVPVLDLESQRVDRGVICQACSMMPADRSLRSYRRKSNMLSSAAYFEHFINCPQSQLARSSIPAFMSRIPPGDLRHSAIYLARAIDSRCGL